MKQGDKLYITVGPTTPLRKLKDRYCLTNAVDRASIAFWFASCVVEEVHCRCSCQGIALVRTNAKRDDGIPLCFSKSFPQMLRILRFCCGILT